MFDHLGWGEIAVLFVVGMLVVGPERIPKLAADAGRLLRQLREMATGARNQLKTELGPELGDLDLSSLRDLRDLHPRRLVEKHLFADDDESAPVAVPRQVSAPLLPNERPPYDADAT